MDYEISPDYFPISPNSIEANTKVGFNLYLRAKTTAEVRFVLYCNENAVFDADKKDTLMVKNISRLFIKKDDLKIFCSGILLHDIGKTRISTESLKKKGS